MTAAPEAAFDFLPDLASRMAERIQLSTDGYNVYLPAIDRVFGFKGIDYGQQIKYFERSRPLQRPSTSAATVRAKSTM